MVFDFSIVTPSYNQGAFIKQNLDSLSAQRDVSVEQIVIDGASTDDTVRILSNYRGQQKLVWSSEKDKGQTDAINKGLRMCHGGILGYLNSDDYLYSSETLCRVKMIIAETGADVVYGDVEVVDAQGAAKRRTSGRPFSLEDMIKLNCIPQPATFFKASVLAKVGYFRDELKYAMDLDYWLRAAFAGLKFHYAPIVFSCFREHENSKTCSQTRELIDEGYNVVRREHFQNSQHRIWLYHKLAIIKNRIKKGFS